VSFNRSALSVVLARAHSSGISFEWKDVMIGIVSFRSIKNYVSESDEAQYVMVDLK
jgi:hypothetical protein